MDLAYLSYLAAHSETGAALFTSDEWSRAMREGGDVRSRGVAAFTLGAHDRRTGNPPRSLAEVTREVERMLAPESTPVPSAEACPENRAPRQGDTWRHMPTLTTWKVLSVLTPGEGPGVYACEGRSHDVAPPKQKRQDILIDTASTAWRLVGAGEP
jgi:hypothetical protein